MVSLRLSPHAAEYETRRIAGQSELERLEKLKQQSPDAFRADKRMYNRYMTLMRYRANAARERLLEQHWGERALKASHEDYRLKYRHKELDARDAAEMWERALARADDPDHHWYFEWRYHQ